MNQVWLGFSLNIEMQFEDGKLEEGKRIIIQKLEKALKSITNENREDVGAIKFKVFKAT